MSRRTQASQIAKMILGAAAALVLPGCITIQAIEPVIEPPHQFTGDVTVPVEFAAPGTIGFRCAERGATFFGLPGINSGACADTSLVTMLDPCMTVTAGAYAQTLCDGVRQYRAEADIAPPAPVEIKTQQTPPTAGLVKASYSVSAEGKIKLPPAARELSAWDNVVVEFVASSEVEMRCAERGAKMTAGHDGLASCADRLMLTIANPCDSPAQSWYTRTLCHEMAHANGWPADHPAYYQQLVLKPASESPQALALARARDKIAQPVLITADATPATISPAPVATPMSPKDIPVELRQFMADVMKLGLNVAAAAPDALAARFKPVAWFLAPAARMPESAPESAKGAVAETIGINVAAKEAPKGDPLESETVVTAQPTPTSPSPLRGRWYGGLSLRATH